MARRSVSEPSVSLIARGLYTLERTSWTASLTGCFSKASLNSSAIQLSQPLECLQNARGYMDASPYASSSSRPSGQLSHTSTTKSGCDISPHLSRTRPSAPPTAGPPTLPSRASRNM